MRELWRLIFRSPFVQNFHWNNNFHYFTNFVSREPVFQIIIAIIYLILETRKGKGIPPKQQVGSELETADYQKFQVNKFLPI